LTAAQAPPLAQLLQRSAQAWQRVRGGQSLERAIAETVADAVALRPAVQDITTGAVRQLALLDGLLARLVERAPAPALAALLAVALSQLMRERGAVYAVVDQSVQAARLLGGGKAAAGFVNGVLRNFLRRRDALNEELQRDDVVRFNAPRWWLDRLQSAFPQDWQAIAATATEMPPLVLRVNLRRIAIDDQLDRLERADMAATRVGPQAIWLRRPRPVVEIPGFMDGDVSVQDAGAQLAAPWLGARDGMRVLDACAAPGGKTAHLAELVELDLTALDIDDDRASRIADNLRRVGLNAGIVIGDASRPDGWWDGRPYQRILLDAPCTASGIVRRHPDIPWLRRPTDVAQLATLQAGLLDALWPLLEVGGRLLYVVCSLFPEEGSEQVARFLARVPEARWVPLPVGSPMLQLTPTPVLAAAAGPFRDGASAVPTLHDGFFYAMLEKVR
jgi:16S rRNA (cytosine967-C5)-methyltransferase